MNIDDLLILIEKSREKIEKIEEDLYFRIKERIDELNQLRKEADDDEFTKIDEELRTLKRIQKRIFEMRTFKIIKLAWADICETESGIEGRENLIEVEREFYRKLRDLLTDFRKSVIEGQPVHESAEELPDSERVLVRVRQDVPEFEGVDGKTYKLRREDVVLIPSLNANALIKSGVAEKIEVKR
ncbi:hypothetical protein [Geoglobus acetivorans]|uniref:GINS subunit domain-containing protein n=1 Tax=Geoglobus acetivorans TaxID=565033 RepID=A0ABZ3H1E9_GEOAI|nr:hypothetical protein [Geoglobus acetivorans]